LQAYSESEIINKILNGNPDLFRVLVERYKSPVAAIIKGMLGDCPEVDDVGKETFIRFYNSLASFRGDAALKTYLIRIAMNLSLNEIKKKKRFNSSTLYIDSGVNIDNDNGMHVSERTEIMEMIQNAMEGLDPRQINDIKK
jgi:RNA polymerase sigma-70 factor (ECF subfamily)